MDHRQIALRRIEELAPAFRQARGDEKRALEVELVDAFIAAGLHEDDVHANLQLVERLHLEEPIEFAVIDWAYAHGFESWAAKRSKKSIPDWKDRDFRRHLRWFLHENHNRIGGLAGSSAVLGYGIRDLRASVLDEQR